MDTFLCRFSIPIRLDEERFQYFPVVGVFRSMPFDQVDRWVMRPDGRPRTDRDLAAEVLVELRRPLGSTGKTALLQFGITEVLEVDRAAAIIVATFLSELPRGAERELASELAG
ncbi:hypothetical protein [Variovorax sp. 770b2]|uniref:hypothetical protein n=1 Tax=Variovorax sp. 770b2 TaxID=1566271 RepID=UPI002109D796|nr:hypothetical protein [Variovorax sp. 770b2]